jgi:hypothetical protein
VAMWDNRVTAHRVIPGRYNETRRGVRTTVFGERPFFDPNSEGREEKEEREAAVRGDKIRGDQGRKFLKSHGVSVSNGAEIAQVPTPPPDFESFVRSRGFDFLRYDYN